MQILQLEMEGFGKFSDNTIFNFDKGLNFISGMNEVGKSTILEGIMASVFKYTTKQIEPFYCWNNCDVCKVALTYKDVNNEIFRVTSDYKNNRRKLEKGTNGNFIEISSLEKNIDPYVKKHFGFADKKVFENTSFIKQSQMAILEDDATRSKIKDMIEEVLVGRTEVTATKTVKKLGKFVRDNKKEILKLEENYNNLRENLEQANENRLRISTQSSNHEKISTELKEKKKILEKLEKNKKLYDEKEKLLKEKQNFNDQITGIDGFIETLSDQKHEPTTDHNRKDIPVIFIIIGIFVAIVSFALSFPIGTIIGIPLIIYGIYRLIQKPKMQQKPVEPKSEKIIQYKEQKKGFINKLAVIDTRLEEYKLVNFTIDDFRGLEELKQKVETLKEEQIKLKTSVSTTTSLVESPEEAKEKLDYLEEKIEGLKNKIEEHKLAENFLEKAQTEVQQKFTPIIEQNSKHILKEVTNNHYKDLKINDETLDVMINAPEKNDFVDASILSQGARDQVYFTLRTVLVDLLCGNLNIPLVLDDPFHNFDEIRLKKTIEVINKISEQKQIILISHLPYHNMYNDFTANIIELR